ncbi:hypothetical protein QF034_006694 [Streptomyces africanus]|uniref:Uncharacterized protein n=1 Tax=Streptomyces africanus TaxID=231024 RepID=A0ABU0QYJ2_9ACTN|nr:hypothetical protein [Streptomyces africanus]
MLRDGVGPGPVGGLEAALLTQQVMRGRVTVDGGRDDQAPGPNHPTRLAQCPGVPGPDRDTGQPRRLFQVQGHRIDEFGLVPVLGKPLRVHTAAAADVQHTHRALGQEPPAAPPHRSKRYSGSRVPAPGTNRSLAFEPAETPAGDSESPSPRRHGASSHFRVTGSHVKLSSRPPSPTRRALCVPYLCPWP